jgi:hypothetical protein
MRTERPETDWDWLRVTKKRRVPPSDSNSYARLFPVSHVQNDGVTGSLDAQHGFREQIAGDPRDDVFGPQAAVGPVTVTTIPKLASGVVGEYNMLLALITNDARLRIRNLAPAWQLQLQERPVAFECNRTATNHTAALAHGRPSRQAYPGALSRGRLPILARSRAKGIDPRTFRRDGDFALFP